MVEKQNLVVYQLDILIISVFETEMNSQTVVSVEYR